jgi:hypothetical protein
MKHFFLSIFVKHFIELAFDIFFTRSRSFQRKLFFLVSDPDLTIEVDLRREEEEKNGRRESKLSVGSVTGFDIWNFLNSL